jgi:hypothetical protein
LKQKNIKGIFKVEPSERNIATPYDSIANTALLQAFADYAKGLGDENTLLRTAEEKANQEIEAKKNAKEK